MARETYNILHVREYVKNKETGEIGKDYTRVGVAWPIESGGMSLRITEGISVTGDLVILPRKEREDD